MRRTGLLGPNLRLARSFQGFTHAELGERLGVSATFVGQLEAGSRRPAPGMMAALGAALGFAPQFFSMPLADELRDEECHLRRRAAIPLAVKTRVLAHGTLFASLLARLETDVRRPVEVLPDHVEATDAASIEAAAAACRRLWGLSAEQPISNLTRVLERAGVVVTRLPASTARVGAFSRVGRRLLIVLDDAPGVLRARFDLAHEAGHVVLHRGADAGDPALEEQADQFARALLLPRAGFLGELSGEPTTDWEARLERRWGVGAEVLAQRALELGDLEASAYPRAVQRLAARGWSERGPVEIEEEVPEVVALALSLLETGRGVTRAAVARELGWSARVFERVAGVEPAPELGRSGAGGKLVSLAAFRAGRPDAAQTELDFGERR